MRFHHIGIAVSNIDEERSFYEGLGGIVCSNTVIDQRQKVRLQLINMGGQLLELVSPIEKNIPSPVDNYVRRRIRIYHTCYEVIDIYQGIAEFQDKGCIEVVKPTPAILFNERLVAFMLTPKGDLIELLNSK